MKDMYGKKVNNGDILVEGDDYGEVALFFRVENNKPVLKVRWSIGVLDKYNIEMLLEHDKRLNKIMETDKSIPEFFKKHWKQVAERLDNVKSEELMLVKDINAKIMNKFIDENHERIEYTAVDGMDVNEKPIAYFPDEQIVGEY